ncbi:hypothetical protein [Chryseobacterium sp. RLHN22]|uniref:hypothetical protein n=1 Tax=Chryseobacterium sp. RLHN22 TaxID=3437885 RepID=UPI003D9BF7AB
MVPELEKAEATFKNSKTNVNRRVIDYGNGVSIDTDHVIYIENGANYHTYTFNIKRQNAPEDAPLENLLLSPLPDGTYQEFLVTYNLTAQEREKIRNGEPVNTKGKTTIAELAKGTFNSGGQLAKMSCNWTEQTIYVTCSDNVHNASNVEQWHQCKAATPPGVYTIVTGGCITEQPEYIDPGNSGGGSSDGGGGPGGDGSNECTTVANNPGEVGIIDENGCHVGGVTQPNDSDDPDERTPCEVLKENSETPYIQTKLDSLKERVALTTTGRDHHETGITIAKRGATLRHKVFKKPKETGIPGVVSVEIGLHPWDILAAHNHYEGTFPVPQFGDILTFYSGYKISAPARTNAYTNYVVNFNGIEYAFRMNDTTALDALLAGLNQDTVDPPATTEQDDKANNLIYEVYRANGFKEDKDYTEDEALKILMNVLNDSDIGSGDGVHLYRRDKTTKRWAKLKLNPDGTVGQDDCPL